MSNRARIAIGSLALSAAALVGLWQQEGWTEKAVIPVPGDVPTYGPGLTKREDGTPVRMGDTITPLEGARRSLAHIQKDEAGLKRCVTAPLSQAEYDLLVDHAYQYGVKATCGSTVVRMINAHEYTGACEAYAEWRMVRAERHEHEGPGFVRGSDGVLRFDCSTPGTTRCRGVFLRSQARRDKCKAAQ